SRRLWLGTADRGQRHRGGPREEPPRRVRDRRAGRRPPEGRGRCRDRQGEGDRGEPRAGQAARRRGRRHVRKALRSIDDSHAEQPGGAAMTHLHRSLAAGLVASLAACGSLRTADAYRADTTKLLASRSAQLQRCYDEALTADGKAAGTVTVQFVIESDSGAI